MANVVYDMNQFVYTGTSSVCMKEIGADVSYLDWQIGSESSPYYRDVLVKLKNSTTGEIESFTTGKSYYLSFGIPRNLNYDLNIAIKLLVTSDSYVYDVTKTQFQFIKYISAYRTTTGGATNSLVCLYQKNGENNARSAIRYSVDPNLSSTDIQTIQAQNVNRYFYEINDPSEGYIYLPNVLYHNQLTDEYWMFTGGTKSVTAEDDPFGDNTILKGTNDVVLTWNWDQDSQSDMAYYKLVISPQNASNISFNAILLQLERISEDADIITDQTVSDTSNPGAGSPIYGRYINIDQLTGVNAEETVKDTFKIYELKDLLNTQLNVSSIARFGLWGHPELMLCVNGEEIQVGPSGYYELNDFDITSLSVVAEGPQDTFTLDYQYEV